MYNNDQGMGVAPTVEIAHDMMAVALEAERRADIDIAISTAKKYPRRERDCLKHAISLATEDTDVAQSCFYKVPRGGKIIEGPSVRAAEIFVYAWGNTRSAARLLGMDATSLTITSMFMDLQQNNGVQQEVRRRILDKNGERYNEDMLTVTANAGASIAWRNGVFRIIPKTYVNALMQEAKRVALGDLSTLAERRTKMLKAFAAVGVAEEMMLKHLDAKRVDEVDLERLEHAIAIYNSIRDGELDPEELGVVDWNGQPFETDESKRRTVGISGIKGATERLKQSRQDRAAQTAPQGAGETAQDAPGAADQTGAKSDTQSQPAPDTAQAEGFAEDGLPFEPDTKAGATAPRQEDREAPPARRQRQPRQPVETPEASKEEPPTSLV